VLHLNASGVWHKELNRFLDPIPLFRKFPLAWENGFPSAKSQVIGIAWRQGIPKGSIGEVPRQMVERSADRLRANAKYTLTASA
jgi:hypothetical protein